MELFVIVFVVLVAWVALSSGGNVRAQSAGQSAMGCLAVFCALAALALFVALPLTIVIFAFSCVFTA